MSNILKSKRNQLSNVNNPYQGNRRKVLCACSAGVLRSPTLANVLHETLGYNTRSCGTASEYALIPMTEALVAWCDEIVFVDNDCRVYLSAEDWELIKDYGVEVYTLDIPDEYEYDSEDLIEECVRQYLLSK